MPRFVLLEHDHPFRHWDLMLDVGESLRTWRLLSEPAVESEQPIEAEPLADHRRAYLDHEGPVSGGRGRVVRRDAGTFQIANDAPSELTIDFAGEMLRGRYALTAVGARWRLQRTSRRDT